MASPPLRRFRPETPRGVCVLVHGLAEHSGRYRHVAEALVGAGYAVYTFDLRGHGQADGFPGKVSAPDEWLDDLDGVLAHVRTTETAPLFLVAHSMGTLVALAYLAERGAGGVRGLVLSGTAVAPGEAVIASLSDPDAPGIPPEAVSRDPQTVRAYAADPLVFNEDVPPECTAAAMLCSQRAFEGASAVSVPALLLHGGGDLICDPSGARDVHEALGSADRTLKIYDGLYHEVFNEPERGRVLADLVAWLDAHL